MPQSSRVMVTRPASARNRASSGGDAAVRRSRSGMKAAAEVLCIGQCLVRLAPACKHLRRRALEQLVEVADAEVIAAIVAIELLPCDRRGDRRAFPRSRGEWHHRRRSALIA